MKILELSVNNVIIELKNGEILWIDDATNIKAGFSVSAEKQLELQPQNYPNKNLYCFLTEKEKLRTPSGEKK